MDLKNTIRRLLLATARNPDFYRSVWSPLTRLTNLTTREWKWTAIEIGTDEDEAIATVCPDLVVARGPFAGLRYPHARSVGSSLFPKLTGSYECELHDTIRRWSARNYAEIVDVGCAEGYYAIGLARMFPRARVAACDVLPVALEACREMARLNGVDDRVECRGPMTRDEMLSRDWRVPALLVCDCEGFEKTLLGDGAGEKLRAVDLLVELHDFIDPAITRTLVQSLAATHQISLITSVPDFCRPQVFPVPSLAQYDAQTQIALMAELRPAEMQWLIAEAQ